MNLINNNPYRILGLPITASEREIVKQINKLATYAEMGKEKSLDNDFSFLPVIERTPHTIEEAKKQIEQSESKLLYSLFWFWKNNSIDELAFEVLKEGNTNKAIEIWEKAIFASKNKVYRPVVFIENLIKYSTNWSTEKDEDHSLTKNEDEYIVERKKETNYSIPTVFADLDFENNWTIECNTEWLAGVDNIGYGIVFGREKGSFYSFEIAANGYFSLNKYIDWTYSSISEWKKSDNVNKWAANHIKIEKLGSQLSFYINQTLVDSIEVEPFFGKSFGFKVTRNQKISFRNLKFCNLVENETYGEGINVVAKNFGSIKNLSTLYLSLATSNGKFQLDYFKKGISLARSFFSTEGIEGYSKLIAGERYIYNSEKILHFYINDVINSLKNYLEKTDGLTTTQLISAFSSFPIEAKQFINDRFVSKQIQNIDKEIEIAQISRKNTASGAADAGKKLVNNIKADIVFLKRVLGESDFQYQIIADKLSLAVVQCGIDFYNATKSDEVYLNEYEFALSIAVSQRAKERAKENLDSCKEWIANKHLYNCWFCGNNPPEDQCKFEVTIYKETSRTYFPRRVNYSYLPVAIPRCKDCQVVHNKSTNKFALIFGGCAVLGLITGAFADGYWFGGLLIGGVIGYILASLNNEETSKKNIKGTAQSIISNYPTLKKLRTEGWQFSKPTA